MLLPKLDQETILDNLRTYVAAMKEFIAAAKNKRDKQLAPDEDYERAKLTLEILEYESRLDAQSRILKVREAYYKNEFMPQFEKEVAEMHAGWDAVVKRCEHLCTILPEKSDLVVLFSRYPMDNTDLEVKNEAFKKFREYADEAEKALKKNPNLKLVK